MSRHEFPLWDSCLFYQGTMKCITGNRSTISSVLGLAVLLLGNPGFSADKGTSHAPPPKLNVQDAPLSREVKAATSFAPVIKKVAPSVVNIYSTMTVHERQMPNPLFDDPFFRQFFGDRFGQPQQPREQKAESLGSGILVTSDGYILTANHVIEGADKVKVALASGQKEYDAKIIGADPATDVAVLKIDAKDTPAAVIADSDKLEVGDTVLAIGNPFAVGQTVTMGIVSAVGRGGFGVTGYENFIQTDAAINPGNSGGALVDAEGRLVGINTWIISRSGGYQGIGFAVPINMARYVMDRLTREGKVVRGYLGINPQPLTTDLAKAFDLPDDSSGVLVGGVMPNTPADKAGLKNGDIILEINGKKMTDPRTLQLLVAQMEPGTKVTMRVLHTEAGRRPEQKTLSATLAELPQEALAGLSRRGPSERGRNNNNSNLDGLDGVEVTDIDARTRRQLGIPNNVRGALVSNVDQDSNAAQAGLRPGDVILEIDRQPVRGADDAVALSEKAKGDRVLLRVWSNAGGGPGATHYLVVDNHKQR
jgi:serine protease Do